MVEIPGRGIVSLWLSWTQQLASAHLFLWYVLPQENKIIPCNQQQWDITFHMAFTYGRFLNKYERFGFRIETRKLSLIESTANLVITVHLP